MEDVGDGGVRMSISLKAISDSHRKRFKMSDCSTADNTGRRTETVVVRLQPHCNKKTSDKSVLPTP